MANSRYSSGCLMIKNTLEIDKTQKSTAEKRLNWQIYRITAEEITERPKGCQRKLEQSI